MSDIVERLREPIPHMDAEAERIYAERDEAAAEIERLKEWKAKVLAAANCDGEEQKRSQVYYQDIAYAVWPNAEVQDKAAELKARAELANAEIERLRKGERAADAEIERLREELQTEKYGKAIASVSSMREVTQEANDIAEKALLDLNDALAEIERLRAALRHIAEVPVDEKGARYWHKWAADMAESALDNLPRREE